MTGWRESDGGNGNVTNEVNTGGSPTAPPQVGTHQPSPGTMVNGRHPAQVNGTAAGPAGAHNGHVPQQAFAPANGVHRAAPQADVVPIHDAGGVACGSEVNLVIFRSSSFARLAHFRRSLLGLPGVLGARIAGFGDQTARFVLATAPGTPSAAFVLPGTRLLNSDGHRVELCVEQG